MNQLGVVMEIDVKNLHPLEVKVLRHVDGSTVITADLIVNELGYKVGQCNQAFSWLEAKGMLAETGRHTGVFYELTEVGEAQQKSGTPAERIIGLLRQKGAMTLPEIASALGIENADVGSTFGMLTKDNVCKMDEEKKACLTGKEPSSAITDHRALLDMAVKAEGRSLEESSLGSLKDAMLRISKKRGAASSPFKVIERETVTYRLTELGLAAKQAVIDANMTGEELGPVTAQILSSGSWKTSSFRPYGVNAPVSKLIPGRLNPYGEYLQWVKDKLCSLGFEEFDGQLVETEFWNGDALFMPQFHSARDIHDVYYVKDPQHTKKIDEPWLSKVATTHENGGETGSRGWQYSFDHEFTRRQVMRSQGTVLSAHQLTHAKVPGKYFGVVRCFRYDQVDATHGADFYQTEGIVIGKDVNLKNLLGLLKMFATEIAGATEVKYVPGYFPFTEPSIEVHIKHPVLGWFELGGSGIFRPEVTKPLGIDEPVLAWGLGIDRMALMHLGINDIRDLFSPSIDSVRSRRG